MNADFDCDLFGTGCSVKLGTKNKSLNNLLLSISIVYLFNCRLRFCVFLSIFLSFFSCQVFLLRISVFLFEIFFFM